MVVWRHAAINNEVSDEEFWSALQTVAGTFLAGLKDVHACITQIIVGAWTRLGSKRMISVLEDQPRGCFTQWGLTRGCRNLTMMGAHLNRQASVNQPSSMPPAPRHECVSVCENTHHQHQSPWCSSSVLVCFQENLLLVTASPFKDKWMKPGTHMYLPRVLIMNYCQFCNIIHHYSWWADTDQSLNQILSVEHFNHKSASMLQDSHRRLKYIFCLSACFFTTMPTWVRGQTSCSVVSQSGWLFGRPSWTSLTWMNENLHGWTCANNEKHQRNLRHS